MEDEEDVVSLEIRTSSRGETDADFQSKDPVFCKCKSTCSRKQSANGRGCPCKGAGRVCSEACKCGTRSKPCQNHESNSGQNPVPSRPRPTVQALATRPSEDEERKRKNERVKEFLETLDSGMIMKLCTRALQRGIGSMDCIDSLLIMEDDDDNDEDEGEDQLPLSADQSGPEQPPAWRGSEGCPDWCKCGNCRNMSQEIENVCCKKKRKCVTESGRFQKLCLDADVFELCIKNRADIRNDREDNTTQTLRKAAYRQYILDKYGYLGKGRRKVAPSCVVWCVRHHYPASTGAYMGFRSH